MSSPPRTPQGARRVIVCDYNQLLQSVTGLLRMSGYAVFQAYDGLAALQLCQYMPDIELLVLNTEGSGTDVRTLVQSIRDFRPGLRVVHIGTAPVPGMPAGVPHLPESMTPEALLETVRTVIGHASEAPAAV